MEKRSSTTQVMVHGIADEVPAKLAARVQQITKHLDAIEALLADAVVLQDAERRKAVRLRGAEEAAALSSVLEFAAVRSELFTSLADEDEGTDPKKFETELLANRLANAQTLSALNERFEALHQRIADSALYTVTLVKPPVLAAYEIAKPFAKRDQHRAVLVPALNYYKGGAEKAAKTRRAHSAASTTALVTK